MVLGVVVLRCVTTSLAFWSQRNEMDPVTLQNQHSVLEDNQHPSPNPFRHRCQHHHGPFGQPTPTRHTDGKTWEARVTARDRVRDGGGSERERGAGREKQRRREHTGDIFSTPSFNIAVIESAEKNESRRICDTACSNASVYSFCDG